MMFLSGIAFLGVSAGIMLVVVSSNSRHGLVQKDYYAAGLQLDQHRAAESAFDSLGFRLSIRHESGALILEALGPGADEPAYRARLTAHDVVLQLRRPDDPSADRDVALTLASDSPPLWVADAPALRRGRWNVKAVFSKADIAAMESSFTHDAP
jgi:nitrogen fixation protein FixH